MDAQLKNRLIDTAARWYALLQSPLCTDHDRADFEAWRRASPENAQAFAAAQRLAEDVFETIAADERLRTMADAAFAMGAAGVEAPQPVSSSARTRHWFVPAGLAAAVAASMLVVGVLIKATPGSESSQRIATTNERRELTLSDGTMVHLDVRSALVVSMTKAERLVALTNGRAIFDVAHDVNRPFSVSTNLGRVTAVGTRFEVRRASDATVVTLAEGEVTVASIVGDTTAVERMHPGEQLSIPRGALNWTKRSVDPGSETAWAEGRLMFRRKALAEAVEEVNRYSATKLRIADQSLAEMPVSGSFLLGDSDSAAQAFAAILPIRVADTGEELLLFRRWDATTE